MAAPVIDEARARELRVRGYVSMVFGDPWEGRVDAEQAAAVTARLFALGCTTVSLGDTIGVATPGQVQAVLQAVAAAGVPLGQVALHLHDTYGQALANVLAGLEAGVTEFDASAGGLGGCPFAKSATGNLATEDLVWMLDGLGIDHGVDLHAVVRTSRWLAEQLGRPSPSRVVAALSGLSRCARFAAEGGGGGRHRRLRHRQEHRRRMGGVPGPAERDRLDDRRVGRPDHRHRVGRATAPPSCG